MKLHILKFLFFALLFFGCERVQSSSQNIDAQDQSKNVTQSTSQDDSVTITKHEFNEIKINVYIENSGSMKGYVNGRTEFKNDLSGLLNKLELKYGSGLRISYIGSNINGKSALEPVKENASNYVEKIQVSKFNKEASAFGSILKDIIDSSSDSTVSILLTDNIISMADSKNQISDDGLTYQKDQISNSLGHKLTADPDFTYFLAKRVSNFNGIYYDKDNKGTTLPDVQRPYCIAFMGKSHLVKSVLKTSQLIDEYNPNRLTEYVSYELKGPNLPKPQFTVVYTRKWSNYLPKHSKTVERIQYDEIRKGAKNIQISLGLDLNGKMISPDYALDKNNYKIYENKYLIDSITKATTNSDYDYLINLEAVNGTPKLKITLIDTLPRFVTQTHIEDDAVIENNLDKIFGFKYFIEGVQGAFSTISGPKKYAEPLAKKTVKVSPNSNFGSTIMVVLLLLILIIFIIILIKKSKQQY
jgi:hypothetical protein